ncbi:hypothetical protein KZJ38_08065 [Paraburkholderia edwinii]|jgi:hypothetical protein|uniref:PEP-CTERM sorting domain-containing protein n=1 Tax=Paraburkholderia edwinii TaxID=2861782 RepID=A0ABX8UTC2_9BURK|nr:hypothetical protein [Paraburkholderia edwinii]QYD70239.1 hypothetical protein KZJ38_08065 [Paraburkholderia edwinii]
MHADRIEIIEESTAEAPGFGQCFSSLAAPARAAEAEPEPTPVGLLTLGIAWLFGLEALLADDRRPKR